MCRGNYPRQTLTRLFQGGTPPSQAHIYMYTSHKLPCTTLCCAKTGLLGAITLLWGDVYCVLLPIDTLYYIDTAIHHTICNRVLCVECRETSVMPMGTMCLTLPNGP